MWRKAAERAMRLNLTPIALRLAVVLALSLLTLAAAGCTLTRSTPTPVPSATPAPSPTFIGIPSITPLPGSQPTPTIAGACTPPSGWVPYTVAVGDSLTTIAANTGSTVAALMSANCITTPDEIFAGTVIYVPFLPAGTPSGGPNG